MRPAPLTRPPLPPGVRDALVDVLARLLLADLERRPVVVEGTDAVSKGDPVLLPDSSIEDPPMPPLATIRPPGVPADVQGLAARLNARRLR